MSRESKNSNIEQHDHSPAFLPVWNQNITIPNKSEQILMKSVTFVPVRNRQIELGQFSTNFQPIRSSQESVFSTGINSYPNPLPETGNGPSQKHKFQDECIRSGPSSKRPFWYGNSHINLFKFDPAQNVHSDIGIPISKHHFPTGTKKHKSTQTL